MNHLFTSLVSTCDHRHGNTASCTTTDIFLYKDNLRSDNIWRTIGAVIWASGGWKFKWLIMYCMHDPLALFDTTRTNPIELSTPYSTYSILAYMLLAWRWNAPAERVLSKRHATLSCIAPGLDRTIVSSFIKEASDGVKLRWQVRQVTYRPSPSLQKGQVHASLRLRLPWGVGLTSSSSMAVLSSRLSPPVCALSPVSMET